MHVCMSLIDSYVDIYAVNNTQTQGVADTHHLMGEI